MSNRGGFHPSHHHRPSPNLEKRKAHWKWNLFDTIVVFTQVADLGGSILAPIRSWLGSMAFSPRKKKHGIGQWKSWPPYLKTSKNFVGELRHLLSPQCSLLGYTDCIWLWRYFGWNVDCSSSSVQFNGSYFFVSRDVYVRGLFLRWHDCIWWVGFDLLFYMHYDWILFNRIALNMIHYDGNL